MPTDPSADAPSRYADVHAAAMRDPEGFWLDAARAIDWATRPTRAFDTASGPYGRWFPDGSLNACWNAVDRHVAAGRADQVAIRYDSPVTGTKRAITYVELLREVSALAAVLGDLGVVRGDRVILYMPMVPEALFGMLACARIGAVHSVVFGGFAANELAVRIEDAAPKVVLAASCGIEPSRVVAYKPLLDAALAAAKHKPAACLILQRPQAAASLVEGRDRDWAEAVAAASGRSTDCVAMAATDPLYVLYTSGTTGKPKGVVRDTGGYLVALAWSMPNLYGVQPGETYFCASDIGWVVGHSYIVYAPLLHGCTTVLYEGKPVGTPDPGAFWRVVAETGTVCLFTAPTALRAIKKEDPKGTHVAGHDLSRFRTLFLAGERADPDSVAWAERVLDRPVIDHWWQTETGWPIAGNPVGLGMLPVKHGSTCVPMPGYDVQVLDEGGKPVPAGTMGTIAIRLPLPPGCLPTLWGSDARMRTSYLETFPGWYDTSDAGVIDADGYITVLGRTDDIINVAGHRLSTGGMEAVLSAHPDVAECAVIGIRDALKGEAPCGFVVLKAQVARDPAEIERELVAKVRDEIGPVAAFKLALTVQRLPKTRSGKILRATMKRIADHEPWTMPATIDDAGVLDEIGESLKARGIGEG
ncbi:propionyl-CoA synthetase [Methylobacterium sp. WL30]|uniref:AMP-binding protein n=1 Tax=unclassified Methylobacterium TaxID=2615210 RepID=UPI0011CCD388|nr:MULTISPECIES: AMP-binding protein [unclassified Methylobacterium]TXM94631.1 propionyl-CoA synthetase [Methylobacterium sp. WL116]TXN41084.1 propionyl-CoA synthetase [Methylobacterium sp. WL93]TXN53170.1 propionyl-CoA synthetase [Methylobacterium sp. WL119]TXN70932.1 propionyl-CoA synthetase [Methylobacterium sp. WL30]